MTDFSYIQCVLKRNEQDQVWFSSYCCSLNDLQCYLLIPILEFRLSMKMQNINLHLNPMRIWSLLLLVLEYFEINTNINFLLLSLATFWISKQHFKLYLVQNFSFPEPRWVSCAFRGFSEKNIEFSSCPKNIVAT